MNHFKELYQKGEINIDYIETQRIEQIEEEKLRNEIEIILKSHETLTRTWKAYKDCLITGYDKDDHYNFVAMDGCKIFAEKKRVILTSLMLRERNIYYSSLVPHITNKTIFYCDIDYLGKSEQVEQVIKHIKNVLSKRYDEESLNEIWITKSESKNRYHVYMPNIIIKAEILSLFWDDINAECQQNGMKGRSGNMPIDTCCNQGIRLDGFDKFNKQKRRYDQNTKYLPYLKTEDGQNFDKFELDKKFYTRTYLLVNDDDDLSGRKRNFNRHHDDTGNDSSQSQMMSSQYSTTSNSKNNFDLNFDINHG